MSRLGKDPLNLIIAGVGGQGNFVASHVIAQAALREDIYTTVGESYGVSQRGGSVRSHVRMTCGVPVGPQVPQGQGDILLGMEPLETLQVALEYGNSETQVLCNPRPIVPIGVLAGDLTYPSVDEMLAAMKSHMMRLVTLPATEIAQQVGALQTMNLVMVGALSGSGLLPMARTSYEAALENVFEGPLLEVNRMAFEQGYRAVSL